VPSDKKDQNETYHNVETVVEHRGSSLGKNRDEAELNRIGDNRDHSCREDAAIYSHHFKKSRLRMSL